MSATQYERSRVAQHNDDARGYWLIIDEVVYDVTELMPAHPGGEPILRLYAGRDATHGFGRAHADRRRVARQLERCRIGVLCPLPCAAHAAHQPAFRALHASLQLIVEMQNALAVDHGFRLEPGVASRYELQRGVDTHARFHAEYLDVLTGGPLIQLAACLVPEQEAGVREQLELLSRSAESSSARSWRLELWERLERYTDRQLGVSVACFAVLDSWLLRMWKHELSRGLRVFERPHAADLRTADSPILSGLCDRLIEHLREYHRSAAAQRPEPDLG
jgi:hypothetical protein